MKLVKITNTEVKCGGKGQFRELREKIHDKKGESGRIQMSRENRKKRDFFFRNP